MVRIPKKVKNRFIKQVPEFQKILKDAKTHDFNEANTVPIVRDMLAAVFGFHKYTEITGEHAIRGTYCDLAILDGKNVRYLIEVKAIGLDLKESHLRQAVNYGANLGVQWVILTNGIAWEIYKIRFTRPVSPDLICSFNFLELNPRKREDQDRLFILCKKGLKKAAIEEFHEHVKSVNKFVIARLVLSDAIYSVICRQLKKICPGLRVQEDEIEEILVNDVLKRDVLEGEAADKAKSLVKKAAGRIKRKQKRLTSEKEAETEEQLGETEKAREVCKEYPKEETRKVYRSAQAYAYALLIVNNKAHLSDKKLATEVFKSFPNNVSFAPARGASSVSHYRRRLNAGKKLPSGISMPENPILRYDKEGKPILNGKS